METKQSYEDAELKEIIETIANDTYYDEIIHHIFEGDADDANEMKKGIAEQITKAIPLIKAVFDKQHKERIDHALKAQAELAQAYEEKIKILEAKLNAQ